MQFATSTKIIKKYWYVQSQKFELRIKAGHERVKKLKLS